MFARPRACRWLVALTLLPLATLTPALSIDRPGGPDALEAPQPVSAATIETLEAWLDERVDWPRRATAPTIRLITESEALIIGGPPGLGHGKTRGIYEPEISTIFLVQPWSANNRQDLAILLHELVHHRQAAFGFQCVGAQEEPAYRAQAAWLAERGLTADVNWFAIVLASGCTPRDIHPG